MSLLDKIEELRNKPESYRKKILAVSMFAVMSVVVLVWLSTLRFSPGTEEEREKKNGDSYSPLRVLGEDAKAGAAKIKNSFYDAINQFKNDEGR